MVQRQPTLCLAVAVLGLCAHVGLSSQVTRDDAEWATVACEDSHELEYYLLRFPKGRHVQTARKCLNALDDTVPVSGRLRKNQVLQGVLDAGDQHTGEYLDRYELDAAVGQRVEVTVEFLDGSGGYASIVITGKANAELRWKRVERTWFEFVVPPGGAYVTVKAQWPEVSRAYPYEISISVDTPEPGRYPTEIRRGRFLAGEETERAESTRLHLGKSYGPTELTWLWHEDGPPVLASMKDPYVFDPSALSQSSMEILGTCRQHDADREILLLREDYGHYTYVSGWRVNSQTNTPEAEFLHYYYGRELFGREELSRLGLGSACTWQREDEARSIIHGLSVDSDGDESDSTDIVEDVLSRMVESGDTSRFRLPTRPLTADAVERALLRLIQISDDIGIVFNGATYATEEDRRRWRVVQIYRTKACDSDGVVLLHDRDVQQWRAIYDVPSGCSYTGVFPLVGMMVQDGKMFVDMCFDCIFWGEYERFVLDMSTMDIVVLSGEDPRPQDLEDPVLDDTYLQSAVSDRLRTAPVGPAGMEFVWIPAGEFRMGFINSGARPSERPETQVQIRRGFWLGKYEVTQDEWAAVMGWNPPEFGGCGRCPVEQISWNEAQDFVSRLNGQEGSEVYRLPTDAEWEYAARGGTTADRYGNLDAIAWHRGGNGNDGPSTHPVGRKEPNAWGLHDMLGNVSEWVHDWHWYVQDLPRGSVTDPRGPRSGSLRMYRGGGWLSDAGDVRATMRSAGLPDSRYRAVGVRLLRTR